MTPHIQEQYNRLIDAATWIGVAITTSGGSENLRQFIEKSRPYANGTLDAVLPHFMSLKDIKASQDNLNKAIKTAEHLLALEQLLAIRPDSEAA
jgi:hypothetical protein